MPKVQCDCHQPSLKYGPEYEHSWYCPVEAARREAAQNARQCMRRSKRVQSEDFLHALWAGTDFTFPSHHEDGRLVTGVLMSATRVDGGCGQGDGAAMWSVAYRRDNGEVRAAYLVTTDCEA